MTMVVSHKQRIHYRFEGEKGAYLLLHHGLFGSSQDWYEAGYVDALRDEFRLIVMDARGHGRSDHPLDPEDYRLPAFADDVIAIMDELDIRNLHFLGYSLGALVGFELLMRHPERVRIVMLAGESPFVAEALLAEWNALAEAIPREGLRPVQERLLAEQRLATPSPRPEEEGEQAAAVALLQGLAREVPRPDEGRISVNSPVALYAGEDDPALERMRDARRRIHRARFVSFPGQGHAGLFRQRELLIAEMLRLLRPSRKPEDGSAESAERGESRMSRGARGRGRGGRVRGEPRPASAPLTPPPPVEVPERSAPAGTLPAAEPARPAHPGQPAPPAEPGAPGEASAGHPQTDWATPLDARSDVPAAEAPADLDRDEERWGEPEHAADAASGTPAPDGEPHDLLPEELESAGLESAELEPEELEPAELGPEEDPDWHESQQELALLDGGERDDDRAGRAVPQDGAEPDDPRPENEPWPAAAPERPRED